MMRSLYSAVTGLKSHQSKMDVIANNIANINTIGFKRSSLTFTESFNQSLGSATAASDSTGRGGQNGSQIGLGVNVGSISTIMTQGAAQTTSNGNDLMINGDGFFIVSDANGYYFTRAGAFEVDATGNIVAGGGYKLCGWQAQDDPDNPGSQKIVQDVVSPLNIYDGDKQFAAASATTSITVDGNLNLATNPEQIMTFSFYDSVGNSYMATGTLKFNDDNKWELEFKEDVVVNGSQTIQMDLNAKDLELEFQDGLIKAGTTSSITIEPEWKGVDNPYNSTFETITIDFSQVTQFSSTVTVSSTTVNGNTAGTMTGYSIDSNGIITGTYSNGETKLLGQIVLANFPNPSGLESVGGNLFAVTQNSGDFDLIGVEAGALGSTLMSGVLEMSNVDISYEFTEMITTQRGFQASSKLISVGDEMIQTLVNM